jgi:putative phosphoribosyl transferase
MSEIFLNRTDAGQQLAQALKQYRNREDVLVLALPRGGVPVAEVVARELNLPLDVLIVRKVGLPANPELAMGAVASGGVEVVNESVTRTWGIGPEQFKQTAQRELKELERREAVYRRGRPPLNVEGKLELLVDDGIATGSTMKAAVAALRKLQAKAIVIAVPVAAEDTAQYLQTVADEVVCVKTPVYFHSVGAVYQDFSQTSDEEVRELLEAANQRQAPGSWMPRP